MLDKLEPYCTVQMSVSSCSVMNCSKNCRTSGFRSQTRTFSRAASSDVVRSDCKRDLPASRPASFCARYESQMELLKKSHTREMDKLKRSSGSEGLQTEVVQLQVEMENMSQKYMEEIENLKVCVSDSLTY